ncbi:MAG: right-handed parallel beta-helix repeat-containing protein [Aureispira sp.]
MSMRLFYWTFVVCFFQMLPTLLATTYVDEAIVVPTTWTKEGSPYIVMESVTIKEGITLTIKEGCTISFAQKTKMIVAGNLIAEGSSKHPIQFLGMDDASWQGLLFLKTCNDYNPSTRTGVKFEYCTFRGSLNSVAALLRSKGCDLLLHHCEVDNCQTAIQTERQAELWLEHSTIKNCSRALGVLNTSLANVRYNKFLNCNSILLGGTTVFEYNILKRITSEGRHSGIVVWMLGGGKVTVRYNQFQKFEDYVLKVHKLTQRSSVLVEKNDFKNNPTNLKLSCEYYNIGNVSISYNNFHNYRRHHVQVYGRCEEMGSTILAIGRNYWGGIDLEELEAATADQSQSSELEANVKHNPPLLKAVKMN